MKNQTNELPEWARKIASKMYPQVNKNAYTQWEVEKLLIAVILEAQNQSDSTPPATEERKE